MTMANNSNASPEIFGFDFQVNATIFLMLDNIKEVEAVRQPVQAQWFFRQYAAARMGNR